MAFKDIFKDNNSYNEKNIVGFGSFAVMAAKDKKEEEL